MSTSVLPMPIEHTSVAQGRGRRKNSNSSHPIISDNSGQPPSIPQIPQHGRETLGGLLNLSADRSSRQPEFPRCLTSGTDSGVTGVGSLGCLTSTGHPSLNHSQVDQSISPSQLNSLTEVDMNSYRKQYSTGDPELLPLLLPLDKSLRQRFEDTIATQTSGDPTLAIGTLLRSYGLTPLAAVGNWSPDVQTYRDLIDNFLAIRAGDSTPPSLTAEVQRHLYLMGGIPVRDLDLGTLAQCARIFTERFGRSFEDVATDAGRANPDKADLKALLGIMGYPFLASASKPDLKTALQVAQRLAVFQGHLNNNEILNS